MSKISIESGGSKRSHLMKHVGSKNTKPEIIVRHFLHRAKLRYRLHGNLPGSPDIILPKYKTVVFVHGCFWHQHKHCKKNITPKINTDYWDKKLKANIERDIRVAVELRDAGWLVLIVWECDLIIKKREATLENLLKEIKAGR